MKLYVMRHGPAEDDAPTGRDADRVLSAAGRERVRLVAQALEDGGESPFAILSSPMARALETAEIVAEVTHLARRVRESEKAQLAGAPGGVEIRRELPGDQQRHYTCRDSGQMRHDAQHSGMSGEIRQALQTGG